MQQQVIRDKLSEFLMGEQCALQLYTTVAARCGTPILRAKYEEFRREAEHHREVLIQLITTLGGDPEYVSPAARIVQFKSAKTLESALVLDGLRPAEIECSDLEDVLLAETKHHADWRVLSHLAAHASGDIKDALQAGVDGVESRMYEHVTWARDALYEFEVRMVADGEHQPARWQSRLSRPEPAIEMFHPAPFTDGLLEGAAEPMWVETPLSRSLNKTNSH